MHLFEKMTTVTQQGGLDFLWLELTNRCNLDCVHCYANSSPQAGRDDILRSADYEKVLVEAFQVGSRRVQFIGGEPTLNRDLAGLIARARDIGYLQIEVYTNLVNLSEPLLDCFAMNDAAVATSIYGPEAAVHDSITLHPTSFEKTIANIRRVVAKGLNLRVSMIVMKENASTVEATRAFLGRMGVDNFGTDRVRNFGRAADDAESCMDELCGSCAGGTLCVTPTGAVFPCIMAKSWPLGSVRDMTLRDIVASDRLRSVRQQIHDSTQGPVRMGCTPDRPYPCSPDYGSPCSPCSPNQNCGPNNCRPKLVAPIS